MTICKRLIWNICCFIFFNYFCILLKYWHFWLVLLVNLSRWYYIDVNTAHYITDLPADPGKEKHNNSKVVLLPLWIITFCSRKFSDKTANFCLSPPRPPSVIHMNIKSFIRTLNLCFSYASDGYRFDSLILILKKKKIDSWTISILMATSVLMGQKGK